MKSVVGIIIIGFIIIYIGIHCLNRSSRTRRIEGLDTMDNSSSGKSGGEAGSASSYGGAIKAQVVKLQDELLISKYRKDYENAIIHLDDYVGFLMLQQTLNIDTSSKDTALNGFNSLNILNNAKTSLNVAMTFLDKQ